MRSVFVLAVLSFIFTITEAATVDVTIRECWEGNDHRGMSLCVSEYATSTRKELDAVEYAMREAIANSNEQPGYLQPVQQHFEASVDAFRNYRAIQCQLRETLAAKGNGGAEIKLACEAELDVNRADQLKAGKWWLD